MSIQLPDKPDVLSIGLWLFTLLMSFISYTLHFATFWDEFLRLAPWVSTSILYIINYEKVNKNALKIWHKIKYFILSLRP